MSPVCGLCVGPSDQIRALWHSQQSRIRPREGQEDSPQADTTGRLKRCTRYVYGRVFHRREGERSGAAYATELESFWESLGPTDGISIQEAEAM
ncbi:hypothetical protein CROQUDRAFT_96762 [Cronartium quercuum f. sp. fusiforme G11]|uniref:Uncharacterized protein n=1 Tax=Cronartium quercuum f. sp. fusiforme G11 TaxID=708437 RepID=A0A9P6NG63_9BASI|nr:hypothetical protein CROQUDRAFT_96762 [Cronartium quercuum f. sp. fusiforme G11]